MENFSDNSPIYNNSVNVEPPRNNNFQQRSPLQNSDTILVLGILSIVGCFCYGIPGLIMGIIALVMGEKAKKEYHANMHLYTEGSFKNANAGYICAIIGTSISAAYSLFILVYLAIWGTAIFTIFSAFK